MHQINFTSQCRHFLAGGRWGRNPKVQKTQSFDISATSGVAESTLYRDERLDNSSREWTAKDV